MFGQDYEEIGSSDKGLILKNSGKVKILWGRSFIDLLDSNGNINVKVKSYIKTVSSQSDIKSDGFYILNGELYVKAGNNIIKLSSTTGSVYVSFLEDLSVSSENKYRALQNIGFVYPVINENNIYPTNGIIYIEENLSLYIVNNGLLSKYTVKIPKPYPELFIISKADNSEGALVIEGSGLENGIIINTLKIYSIDFLTILEADEEFLFKIRNKNIVIIDLSGIKSDLILSMDYSQDYGYRLSQQGSDSILDIDNINLRRELSYNPDIEVKIGDISSESNYNDKGFYSESNVLVGTEFKTPKTGVTIDYKHFPLYTQNLLNSLTSTIIDNDGIILPKKITKRVCNYIEDLTDSSIPVLGNNNARTGVYILNSEDVFEGKLFLFKITSSENENLKFRFESTDINCKYLGSNILVSEFELNTIILFLYKNNEINVIGQLKLELPILRSSDTLDSLGDEILFDLSNYKNLRLLTDNYLSVKLDDTTTLNTLILRIQLLSAIENYIDKEINWLLTGNFSWTNPSTILSVIESLARSEVSSDLSSLDNRITNLENRVTALENS